MFNFLNYLNKNIDCPIEALGSILGKKWVGQIIWALKDNPKRFNELHNILPECSKKMLKQQLNLLIEHEIICNNKITSKNIVESSYYLTLRGKELIPIIEKILFWGNELLEC